MFRYHSPRSTSRPLFISCLLVLCALTQPALADSRQDTNRPTISIIIDDIGYKLAEGSRAIELPGAIAYAFLPHTPHAITLAKLAHSHNKEIMLHAPMQASNAETNHMLGPGALTMEMSEQQFIKTLQEDLNAIPHVIGINNHMGSLLTRHPGHMLWLMRELNRRGDLFFVDSLTSNHSVAQMVANEFSVPALQRDIFLDHEATEEFTNQQFDKLIRLAQKRGSALAIGHPYESTLNVLEQRLLELEALEINLIPVSEMIKHRRDPQWQASLSHSPKAAKSLKP